MPQRPQRPPQPSRLRSRPRTACCTMTAPTPLSQAVPLASELANNIPAPASVITSVGETAGSAVGIAAPASAVAAPATPLTGLVAGSAEVASPAATENVVVPSLNGT